MAKEVTKKTRKQRESFGAVRKLPSGRVQASYIGLDGKRHTAPGTFSGVTDARGWLAIQQAALHSGEWSPVEAERAQMKKNSSTGTFIEFANVWLETRVNRHGEPLRPRTRTEYERLLAGPLKALAKERIVAITPAMVRQWYADQLESGTKTQAARGYGLLKSILATAVQDGRISTNPCMIRGAQNATTGREVRPPTPAELAKISKSITPRFKAMVLIAAWGGLRYGELTELRRKDLTIVRGETDEVEAILVTVNRAVSYAAKHGYVVGKPKSDAGVRTVALPPNIETDVIKHLKEHTGKEAEALLFPAIGSDTHLPVGTWAKHWNPARISANREDMPFHALRHFAGTRYAQTGATLKEIQARLGHSTVGAAMRYQHEAGRELDLVRRMSEAT